MKKIIILLFAFALIVSCKEEKKVEHKDSYTISGEVIGVTSGAVKVSEYTFFNQNKARVIHTANLVDGKFTLEGKVDFPDMVHIMIADKFYGNFFLENNDISVKIDVTELPERNPRFEPEVKGSHSHEEYISVNTKNRSIFDKAKYDPIEEVRNLYAKAKKTGNDEFLKQAQKKQEELAPLYAERTEEFKDAVYSFVRKNPSSTIAPHILSVNYSEGRMTKAELKEFYHIFKGNARETGFFKNYITKIYKDNFENLGIGNTTPDFTLTSVKGEDLTLSKIEGKYLLVDFWASWCVPCRASFPHLKELYKEYGKEGFEIVGVGTADEEVKWRKAIKEDKTPWIHVYDVSENHAYGKVAKSYGVPHLPTTFLIDSDSKIILRNPKKEELEAKLKELFGH